MNSKYVYIAGYGRSGSTILDLVLGQSNGVFSCGELSLVFDEWLSGYTCSCGAVLEECSCWSFLDKLHSIEEIERLAEISSELERMLPEEIEYSRNLDELKLAEYSFFWNGVIDRLFEKNNVLIDSSKTALNCRGRPVLMEKVLGGCEVKVIHLQRSLYSVLKSTLKGSNRKIAGKSAKRVQIKFLDFAWGNILSTKDLNSLSLLARVIPGWILANKSAFSTQELVGTANFLKVDFEEFIADPILVIDRLELFLDTDLSGSKCAVYKGIDTKNSHLIAGNRVAQDKHIVLRY